MAARRVPTSESRARREKRRSARKERIKNNRSDSGRSGRITYTTPKGGKFKSKKEAQEFLRKKANLPKKGETKRVQQDDAIFKVSADGGFERVSFTPAERKRRERIKKGSATASELLAGADTQTARGQRKVLNRLQPALRKQRQALAERRAKATQAGRELLRRKKPLQIKKQDLKKISSTLGVSFNPRLSTSQILAKYRSKVEKPRTQTKLSLNQINFLANWADEIRKRGEQLTDQEQTFLSSIKISLNNARKKSDRILNKLPNNIANLAKITSKASQKFNNYLANLGVGVAYTPARIAEGIEKSLFRKNLQVASALRNDFKKYIENELKENKRLSPKVQASLREAFKDPATYVFAVTGARASPKINTQNRPVVINKPKSLSPTAKVLKNRIIVDKKTNKLYYVDSRGLVGKIEVTNNVPKITYPKEKQFNFKKLGFDNNKQYNKWVKLNDASRNAKGKKLQELENKIAKLENKIVNAKNKKAIQREKAKLENLKKARLSRSKRKPKKTTISKSAQKRSELARSKQLKAKKTSKELKRKGFKNLKEFNQAKKLGFSNKKAFVKFQRLVEKASQGNKRADALIIKRFRKISKNLKDARKKAAKFRSETLQLKKDITKARKKRPKGKKATKKKINNLISVIEIKGKKGQLSLDQALYQIKSLKKQKTKVSSKLRLRTQKNLNLPKYKFMLRKSVLPLLSNSTLSQYRTLQDIKEILTSDYINQFKDLIKNILKDIVKNIPKQKTNDKVLLNYINKIKKKLKTIKKTSRKQKVKEKPKKIPVPKLKLPELKFDSKKLENRILTFKGTFRERRNPNKNASKSNPVVSKTFTLRDTKNRALKRVAKRVDNSLSASLKLKVVGVGKSKKDIKKPTLLRKFRSKKTKNTPVLRLVERNKFRFDKKSEEREAKRLRRRKKA